MRVTSVGRLAAQALRIDSAWEVCAVFRRSFYCRGRRGSVVWLGPAGLGRGPLNVLCAAPEAVQWDAGLLAPGDPMRCEGDALRVAGRFVFSLAEAAVWRPARHAAAWSPARLEQGVRRLTETAGRWPVRGGLQELLPHVAGSGRRNALPAAPLLRRAMPGVVCLRRWVDESRTLYPRPARSPFPEAECLIGLGPGLTPSGDDFIGGVLVALHVFGYSALAERLAAEMLPRARQRTNAISVAHLACAAEGEGAEALHDMLNALAMPEAPELEASLQRIDAIGHTSGWDALAGAALVMGAIANRG